MIKKVILSLGLLVLFSCAAFQYRWYGMDASMIEVKQLEKLDLIAGRRGDKDNNGRLCYHLPEQTPRCVVMRAEEFRDMLSNYAEMEQRLEDCGN